MTKRNGSIVAVLFVLVGCVIADSSARKTEVGNVIALPKEALDSIATVIKLEVVSDSNHKSVVAGSGSDMNPGTSAAGSVISQDRPNVIIVGSSKELVGKKDEFLP